MTIEKGAPFLEPFFLIFKRYSRRFRSYVRARLLYQNQQMHREQKTRWETVIKRVSLAFAALFSITVAAVSTFFILTYLTVNLNVIAQPAQIAYLYYSDGGVLSAIIPPEGNRIDVSGDKIPDIVKKAVIATEDREFYSNLGFSIKGFSRAAIDRLFGDEDNAGGGSTITQQFVKNAVTGNEHSLSRKWRELAYSIKLTHEWSKDRILTAYLNTVYFGRDAYGIAVAARTFFNTSVEKLTVGQAALLAGFLRGPAYYDPQNHYTQAKQRWNYVLDSMVEMNYLDADKRKKITFPKVEQIHDTMRSFGPTGLIRQRVIDELASLGFTHKQLSTQGLRIVTTINKKVQNSITQAVADNLLGQPATMRAAVVSVDPQSGSIRGYYGGARADGWDYAQAGLQTGSSFKVFALLAALEQNIPLSATFDSSPYTLNGITIRNSDNESCGRCNLAKALKMSLNTVYYRLMEQLNGGSSIIAEAAHRAGIAEHFGKINRTLVSTNGVTEGGIVLGQYESRVIDMASAYATIAASGTYYRPRFIEKVVDTQGHILYDGSRIIGQKRFSDDVANNVIAAMKPIAAYSRSHFLKNGRKSAAKTGTTQLGNTGANKDAWMIGFTPQLSTAVWVGSDLAQPLVSSRGAIVYGSGIPADIWKQAMDGALEGEDEEDFPAPGKIAGQAGVPPETTTVISTPKLVFGNLTLTLPPTTVTTVIHDGEDPPQSPVTSSTTPKSPISSRVRR